MTNFRCAVIRALSVLALASGVAAPARATQVAVVPITGVREAPSPVDVRALGAHALWIAPDWARVAWPANAVVLTKGSDEEFFLLREHGPRDLHHHGPIAPEALARVDAGTRELVRVDGFVLVAADADASSAPGVSHCRERLAWIGPNPGATVSAGPARLARAADPAVKVGLVDQVDASRYAQIIRQLSGDALATTSNGSVSIDNRSTLTAGSGTDIDDAIVFLREQFEASGYTVIEQTFTVGSKTARNLLVARTGTVNPSEVVVVGAHYDSTSEIPLSLAPGAEDNASGTSAVVHLAEVFASYDTERTVHFVLFGGEEQGLYGSQHYVQQAALQGWTVVGALTMDMISAWRDDYAVVIEGQLAWKPLMDVMAANVTEFAQIPYTQTFFSFGSDHVPFQQAGIPAFLAIDDDWDLYADYHRSTDTFDKVDPTLGWRIARAIAGSVVDLAGAAPQDTSTFVPRPRLALEGNVPNPFNPSTSIAFEVPSAGHVRLEVLDARGRIVDVLLDARAEAGRDTRDWHGTDSDGRPVASGVYFYRLTHESGERTRRMVLVR